ncbi:MAG: DNA internalization-related competence protein ComEC/Rec2 [Anaerovorax sp.]|nr:DNA internalization-related competence protein ComEC/Rec2 [Anaerovorax sp.]
MRRPFAFLFFCFLSGIIEQALITNFWIAFCIKGVSCFFIGSFCFLMKGEWRKSVVWAGFFLFIFLTGMQYFSFFEMKSTVLDTHIGEMVSLKGTVQSVSQKEESSHVLLKIQSYRYRDGENETDWQPIRERILLTVWEPETIKEKCLAGKMVDVRGILELPQRGKNPGCFDYLKYLRSRKIRWVMSVNYGQFKVQEIGENNLKSGLDQFKQKGIEALQDNLSKEKSGLLIGMLFGDKNYMDENLYESFQRNGIAHILAVSGIHVNLLYLYINRCFKKKSKTKRSFYTLIFLLLYTALADFSPSVVRASLMITIHVLGSVWLQRYDFFNAICFSCFLQIIYNPYTIYNVGFQLSYLAVYSLAVILPWVDSRIDRMVLLTAKEWIGSVGKFLSPLFVLQFSMAPIIIFHFNFFSFVGFLLNPPVLFLAGMLIPIGMSLMFLCGLPYISGIFFGVTVKSADLLLEAILKINDVFALWGRGCFWLVSPPLGFLILFYGGLFFYCTELHCILRRTGNTRRIYTVFALIVVCACVFPWSCGAADVPHPFSRRLHQLTFVDVGQGDCLHIRTPSGKNILIDGGGSARFNVGKKVLLPYLLKNGVNHIDLAIVTHLHTDHFKGIQELSVYMPIKYLGIYEGNEIRTEMFPLNVDYAAQNESMKNDLIKIQNRKAETKILYLKKGDRVKLEKEIWLDILAPKGTSSKQYHAMFQNEDENATSLIIRVNYSGFSVLMTGDMGFEGEKTLMETQKNLNCNVLKVGHHGSAYSTSEDFLNAVNPQIAVIQVGKNNFGHPALRVIELFQKYDIIIGRNDLEGAVFLDEISSENVNIESFCYGKKEIKIE